MCLRVVSGYSGVSTGPRLGETTRSCVQNRRNRRPAEDPQIVVAARVPHTYVRTCAHVCHRRKLGPGARDAINVSELINRHATEKGAPVAISKGSAADIRQTNVNSHGPHHPLPSAPRFRPVPSSVCRCVFAVACAQPDNPDTVTRHVRGRDNTHTHTHTHICA